MTAVPGPAALDGVDVAALRRWLDERRAALVDDLVAYAECETPSDDGALLAKGLAHVESWLGSGWVRRPPAPTTSPPSTATSWCSSTRAPGRTC